MAPGKKTKGEVKTEHSGPNSLAGWEAMPDATEGYEVALPESGKRKSHIPETPFRKFSEQERAELHLRAWGDTPNGGPDPAETFEGDAGVLDFNRPWPHTLGEPDRFSAHLHDWAEKSLGRLEVKSSFLRFVPFRNALSKEAWSELDEILYGFIAELRVAQGEMALFQPSQATEFQKVRAIVPAAPALLRLDDWIVNLARPDAGLYEWNALTPIAQGPIEVDYCGDLTKKIPQNFAQIGDGGYVPFDHALHLEVVALRQATLKLRDIFGAPDAWVKRREHTILDSIYRSLLANEVDGEQFLAHLQQLLGARVDDLQYRGELARAILPLSALWKKSQPKWMTQDHPFRYVAGCARWSVDNRLFGQSNSRTLPGDGGPRMPEVKQERASSGIPQSLREQATKWLERESSRRWAYVEDSATAESSQGDVWDLWSRDLSGQRACRRNGKRLGAYYDVSADPLPEVSWEFVMRYLPERDTETLRKLTECQPGEVTQKIKHTDYVHLRRALAKVPDRWDLRELQEYQESVIAKERAGFADQQKRSFPSCPIGNGEPYGEPAVGKFLDDGTGSWLWAWDKTHLRNFFHGYALDLCPVDEFGNMVSGAHEDNGTEDDGPKPRTDSPIAHRAVEPTPRFAVKRDPTQPWSEENVRPVR